MKHLACFAIFLVAACDCSSNTEPECTTSADCPMPQICVDGECQLPMTPMDSGIDTTPRPIPDAEVDGGTCATGSEEAVALPVDIIIAVDQSASTGEERDAIQANINTNMVEILEASGLDYRVILINSSSALCPGAPLGDPSDCLADNPPRYYRIPHPVNNSDALTLLLWTYDGFSKRPNSCVQNDAPELRWRDFLRFDALKVFIVFSDDDPTSFTASGGPPSCRGGGSFAGCTNGACPTLDCAGMDWGSICPNFGCPTYADRPADWVGGMDFPSELYALEPAGMFGTAEEPKWVFHSLVGIDALREPEEPLSDRCAICNSSGNTAENAGLEYQKLSILTGGVRFPSCNTDYSPVFTRISEEIVPLACVFDVESTSLGMTDPDRTNVRYVPGDGSPGEDVLQDQTRDCDVDANGWQWNADFTRITLCGLVCDRIKADPDGRVEITVGCETMLRPPI